MARAWLDALARADEEEKEWRKKAKETLEVYRRKRTSRGRKFNILHSNVETLCPALYDSTPVPDVRRRFSDPDPVEGGVRPDRALALGLGRGEILRASCRFPAVELQRKSTR